MQLRWVYDIISLIQHYDGPYKTITNFDKMYVAADGRYKGDK